MLQAAYGAVDLLVVGQFGDAASISAVGTGSAFMQMVTFILTSLAMGSTIIIAQHIGEKRPKAAGDAVGTTIVLFLIIGIALTVILEIFAGNIAEIMQVPARHIQKRLPISESVRWNSGDYCIQCDQRHPKRRRKR